MSRDLTIRAKEIIDGATARGEKIGTRDAYRQAVAEMFGRDVDKLLDFIAESSAATVRALEKGQYELPEPHQDALFDTPSAISVRHVWYPKSEQTVGIVGQYIQDGKRHHAVQSLRFDRAEVDWQKISESHDDTVLWQEARRGTLTSGESDE